ncbi:MAG TPA: uroporphyrinogen-III C-methyltransferase [Candidatus Dormibacteraeota bacterium]|nr:uroporphyrinogen-III C-methyltransferase [Candidatus Dormibacteraeota bacterium]
MRYYPVFIDLAGQLCIVLGDGKFAVEKAAALREAEANVRVISSHDYKQGALAGARLVVDASEDPEINRLSWDEAEAAGILINVVDRPAQCRFIAPAIVRRDPLLIAISTSGESPFLASALRARIERWLGREWGPFVALVGNVRRQLREKGVPEQTRIYRRIVNSDVRNLLRRGRSDDAAHLAVAIAQAGATGAGRVALVGAGPGDPDLLTFKARELLADADYVLHDALIAPETLALCGPDARIEDVGKRAGLENPTQEAITARLIELARAGSAVVRLKGGDPFVFGRGGEELADLVRASIDVVLVPGVSAALAAPAAAGIPMTLRGVASSFAITTAQGGGSLDRLRDLALAADTLVVLMPRANLAEVARVLAQAVGGSRPAALIGNATLPDQRSVNGPLDRIARLADEAAIEAPATLVVGDVVAATSIVIDSFRHNSMLGGSSQDAPPIAVAQPG